VDVNHQTHLAEMLDRTLRDDEAAFAAPFQVRELLAVARAIEVGAADVTPGAAFRSDARARILRQISAPSPRRASNNPSGRERMLAWVSRFAAGLAACGVVSAAAATASASALPGDPLYVVKQDGEALALRLTFTEAARQQVLLAQADTRLDETAQLLQQGRLSEAAASAARYQDVVDVATTTGSGQALEARLEADQGRVSELLQSAPPAARPGLERARDVTQRALARAHGQPQGARPMPAKRETESDSVEPGDASGGASRESATVEPSAPTDRLVHVEPSATVEASADVEPSATDTPPISKPPEPAQAPGVRNDGRGAGNARGSGRSSPPKTKNGHPLE
jgi:uncharacterized protein DUF5667